MYQKTIEEKIEGNRKVKTFDLGSLGKNPNVITICGYKIIIPKNIHPFPAQLQVMNKVRFLKQNRLFLL